MEVSEYESLSSPQSLGTSEYDSIPCSGTEILVMLGAVSPTSMLPESLPKMKVSGSN